MKERILELMGEALPQIDFTASDTQNLNSIDAIVETVKRLQG